MLSDDDLILLKNITGYTSTTLLTLLYIPQVFWTFRRKDSRGLTWTYLIIAFFLIIDTIIYGALLGEPPLIIANVIAFICVNLLMVAKCLWPPEVSPPIEVQDIENLESA